MGTLRFLISLIPLIVIGDAALAAMTIDLGTQFIKVGIVKPGIPMDIALNPESRRKTPNVVMIQDGHRMFGDAAIGLQVRYPHLVIGNINDLVAKKASHPSVALFKERNPLYEMSGAPRNESSVNFKFGEESFSVETLLAMTLANAKKFTEEHAQVPNIKDVVISVPVYFTPTERLAVERAAQIAGLNVLQLINDGTAAALSHAIFRRKEITEKPQRLMVYDMGAAKTTATIVEYKLVKAKYDKQPKMTVIGIGYDRTLGGIEITNRLREKLIDMFEKTYKPKTPVRENRRSFAKFAKEAERLKQILSANAEHFAQIESAHEDIDVRLKVTRADLNELIADLEPRMSEPIEQALRMAQMPIDYIDQVVLMGAGTRVPKVQEVVQRTIGTKEMGKFLNTDEATAMGALYKAAHLSNGFKVKPFDIEELSLFPIEIHFVSKVKDENEKVVEKNVQKTLYAANSLYPTNPKSISLTSYEKDFRIALKYGKNERLTTKQINDIGNLLDEFVELEVNGLTDAMANGSVEEIDFKGVKLTFQIDESGILRVKKAEATIDAKAGIVGSIANTISGFFSSKNEEGDPVEVQSANSDDEKEKNDPEDASNKKEEERSESKNNTTSSNGTNANSTKKEDIKKPTSTIVKLKIKPTFPTAFVPNSYDVKYGKERLRQFSEVERLATERAAAENELESFNFETSQMLEDEMFTEFAAKEELEKLQTETSRIRVWLEDDVTKETPTKEFKDNLLILKNVVRSVKKRARDSKEVPLAMDTVMKLLESSETLGKMGENKSDSDALFEAKDREAFNGKIEKVRKWYNEMKEKLDKKSKTDDFDVTAKDIKKKVDLLNKEVDKFMKKMKKVKTLDDLKKDKKIVDIDEVAAEAEKLKNTKKEESAKDDSKGKSSEKENESGKKTEL